METENEINYAGKKCELVCVLNEDENENWDVDLAQAFCDKGGCVIHKGVRHLVYSPSFLRC